MLNISTMTRGMNYGVSRARIGSQPLSDDDIMSVAPSVFADKPHESRSSRYVYVDTRALLAEYRSNGWQVVRAQQSKSRISFEEILRFPLPGQQGEVRSIDIGRSAP